MQLSNDEIRRYARHLTLREVGREGQERIRAASILCLGAGGLGSPVALYLAAAGVGRLGLVDSDAVDVANLQRQVLHRTADIGRPKVDSATERLRSLNPHVQVTAHPLRFCAANALELIAPYDLVVDGTDNFPTRYVANDACVILRKPNIYGAIFQFEGQASVFAPHLGGPCYRCLYPEPPPPGTVPDCAEAGVLGVLPGIVGCIQATEALKLVLGAGTSLLGRLLLFDALAMTFRELKVRRDPQCPVCGPNPTITRPTDSASACGVAGAPGAPSPDAEEVTVQDLKRALEEPALGIRVIDVREASEREICSLPGATHCPLGDLPRQSSVLDPADPLFLVCRSGWRSLQAVRYLKARGFKSVHSVRGGILAWSTEIDPSMPRY